MPSLKYGWPRHDVDPDVFKWMVEGCPVQPERVSVGNPEGAYSVLDCIIALAREIAKCQDQHINK